MTFEAFMQLSDATSFILVTPEFLGEERLTQFRKLGFMQLLAEFVDENRVVFIITIFLFLIVVFGRPVNLGYYFALVSSGFIGGFMVIMLVLGMLQLIAYRSILFILGAALFMVTRAIAFYHA